MDIGNPVSVTFQDGETVEGWFYGELPQGLLISLDPGGKEIRLIPQQWRGMRGKDGPPAVFSPPKDVTALVYEADVFIRPKMKSALKEMNFTFMQNAAMRARELSHEIIEAEQRFRDRWLQDDDPGMDLAQYVAAKTDQVVELHTEVYDELERVKVATVVQESAERLRTIPGKYLLPAADAQSRREADSVLADLAQWQEVGWTEVNHRRAIDNVVRRRSELLIQVISKQTVPAHEDKKSVGGTMRYFGAGVRVLVGTGLAVANLGLSVTAGLASALLTIGATSVPTYVGAVASVGTGLFQVAEGLEKIGGIQKDKA